MGNRDKKKESKGKPKKKVVPADQPQNGDQRLNNVGQLESYYEGSWNVREISTH
jgi:hypothetical protein